MSQGDTRRWNERSDERRIGPCDKNVACRAQPRPEGELIGQVDDISPDRGDVVVLRVWQMVAAALDNPRLRAAASLACRPVAHRPPRDLPAP
jgi:hypothetical protein